MDRLDALLSSTQIDHCAGENLLVAVQSLFLAGIDPVDAEEESDIAGSSRSIFTTFTEESVEPMAKLYSEHVNRVRGLDSAIQTAAHSEPYRKSSSNKGSSTSQQTGFASNSNISKEAVKLAVMVEINEKAMYDIQEAPTTRATRNIVRARGVAKRLTQGVEATLKVREPRLMTRFAADDYFPDTLCAAVQVIMYSPPAELKEMRPGLQRLRSQVFPNNLQGDWIYDDEKVKDILANKDEAMDALVEAVKLLLKGFPTADGLE